MISEPAPREKRAATPLDDLLQRGESFSGRDFHQRGKSGFVHREDKGAKSFDTSKGGRTTIDD